MEVAKSLDILTKATQATTVDCFNTLFGLEISESASGPVDPKVYITNQDHVLGKIQLEGDCKGALYLVIHRTIGEKLAKALLMMDEVAAEDIGDTVGEFANILSGSVKTDASNNSLKFELSTPEVISGESGEFQKTDLGQVNYIRYLLDNWPLDVLVSVSG